MLPIARWFAKLVQTDKVFVQGTSLLPKVTLASYSGSGVADGINMTMAKMDRDKCLFCKIVDETSPDLTQLVYKDDELVVFPDIRPAAKFHFLVVTREHIKDAKCLKPNQIGLVDRMIETGRKVVMSKCGGETQPNFLFGFHWPPFHSVAHLHLHVIAPVEDMGFISRMIFRPNSWWFVSPEYVKDRLKLQAADPDDGTSKPC